MDRNVLMIQEVVKALGPLKDELVFVGGATVSLYIDDAYAPPITPSDDIDCIIEVSGATDYHQFEKKLRKRGFKQPMSEERHLICRWEILGITVDVMPTDEKILGFSNRWYKDGIKNKATRKLPNGDEIYALSVPYFLATKMEAFKARGSDPRMSHDIEDILSVVDGCSRVVDEIKGAPKEVREYLKDEFEKLLADEDLLLEAIGGFLRFGLEPAAREANVLEKIKSITLAGD